MSLFAWSVVSLAWAAAPEEGGEQVAGAEDAEGPEASGGDATSEEVDPDAPRTEGTSLAVKRRTLPRYPNGKVEAEQHCEATVIVERDGVPSSIEVKEDGCAAAFRTATQKALEEWRWEPPMFEGEPVRAQTSVKTVFRQGSGSFQSTMSAEQLHTIRRAHVRAGEREDDGVCEVTATLHSSADVSGLATNDPANCLVIPTGGQSPKKVWKVVTDAPESCSLKFLSQSGTIRGLEYTGCDSGLMKPTEKMLGLWKFNDTSDGREYALTLTFDPKSP